MSLFRLTHLIAVACLLGGAALAMPSSNEVKQLVSAHTLATALLTKDTIQVQATGTVAVAFSDILASLAQTKLIDRIQSEYARTLPAGQAPEFVVTSLGSNIWSYTNRSAEQSIIHEVTMQRLSTNELVAVFYASGERFFGRFESLTAIRLLPAGPGRSAYEVAVFAYPQQALCRFFIRHLGLIESYFRNKTREIEKLATSICRGLCSPPPLPPAIS